MRARIFGLVALAALSFIWAEATYGAFGGMGRPGFGKEGALPKKNKTSSPVVPCSGTGLIFTSACNSQYIGIL